MSIDYEVIRKLKMRQAIRKLKKSEQDHNELVNYNRPWQYPPTSTTSNYIPSMDLSLRNVLRALPPPSSPFAEDNINFPAEEEATEMYGHFEDQRKSLSRSSSVSGNHDLDIDLAATEESKEADDSKATGNGVQLSSPYDFSNLKHRSQELSDPDQAMDDSEVTDDGIKLPGDTGSNSDENLAQPSRLYSLEDSKKSERRPQDFSDLDQPMDDSKATGAWSNLPGNSECNGEEILPKLSPPNGLSKSKRSSKELSNSDLPMDDGSVFVKADGHTDKNKAALKDDLFGKDQAHGSMKSCSRSSSDATVGDDENVSPHRPLQSTSEQIAPDHLKALTVSDDSDPGSAAVDPSIIVSKSPNNAHQKLSRLEFAQRVFSGVVTALSSPLKNECKMALEMPTPHVIHRFLSQQYTDLKVGHLATLNRTNWINDEVINAYSIMIDHISPPGTKIFNSYFYSGLDKPHNFNSPKIHWRKFMATRRGSLTKMMLFPVHEGENHWAAGCIEFENRQVSYFNSIGRSNFEEFASNVERFLEVWVNSTGGDYQRESWDIAPVQAQKQGNWHDCGPHILAFFLLKALGSEREITPPGMNNFRTNIQLQLIRGSIFLEEYDIESPKTPRAGLRKFKSYKRL